MLRLRETTKRLGMRFESTWLPRFPRPELLPAMGEKGMLPERKGDAPVRFVPADEVETRILFSLKGFSFFDANKFSLKVERGYHIEKLQGAWF